MRINARCVCGPNLGFQATTIERRQLGPHDVLIDIAYAGICHSDVEHAREMRGKSTYPLVPGHEIAGIVSAIGPSVTHFKVGDRAGVGNMIESCRECESCRRDLEQYCANRTLTYNARDRYGMQTYGGYSEKIVVDEHFAVHIPASISLAQAAPLLCAGITLYSPLRHWKAGPGKRVAIVGLGGLGHLGVRLSSAMGAHTTVLEIAQSKREDAYRLGADQFYDVSNPSAFGPLASSFDLIISTVPAKADVDVYLGLLAIDGTLVNLSIPPQPLSFSAASLLANRRSLAGTRSGGLRETQEMLEFCAANNISADVEVVDANQIDVAFERLLAGDVRYRFVIDTRTLASQA